MSLLRDDELIAGIAVHPPAVPYVTGIELPANPYSADSPVQGASLDLHIGNIYLPGVKKGDVGGVESPKFEHSLQTGETAVVTTKERLHLPGRVAGIGFPPSSVSFKGLLMTNPGHVDPGYDGFMRFTVINMAKDDYVLRRGDRIVRLLLFRMDADAHSNWAQRHPEGSCLPTQAEITRLSKDFVDVENRAKKIATQRGLQWTLILTSVVAVLVALLQALAGGHLFYGADIEELKKRQELVEYDIKNRVAVEQKLEDFAKRLNELERTRSSAASGQRKAQGPTKPATNVPEKRP
jgi:deoxycytidine triphosphate deaminase